MSELKILHNPRCSKSRKTLELIQQRGLEPEIIKYLESPLEASEIKLLIKLLGVNVDDILRKGEEEYKLYFKNQSLSDMEKVDLMTKHPKVIERPIVYNKSDAIIGRPPENVLKLL